MTTKQRANRKRWVKALRSGEYKQTRNAMRAYDEELGGTGYCCLGVASDIMPGVKSVSSGFEYPGCSGVRHGMPAAKFMAEEFGMTQDQMNRLADQNDRGRSFKQIAAAIERMS